MNLHNKHNDNVTIKSMNNEMRKKEEKEYLSQDEFDAIMELNAKLRY